MRGGNELNLTNIVNSSGEVPTALSLIPAEHRLMLREKIRLSREARELQAALGV